MKRLLSLLFIIFFSFTVQSQGVLKMKAFSASAMFLNNDGTWDDWSDWKKASVLFVLDNESKRITLYSDPKRVFDIIETEKETTSDGNQIWKMFSIDNKGDECYVVLQQSLDGENTQIYVQYSNYIFVYNVDVLES